MEQAQPAAGFAPVPKHAVRDVLVLLVATALVYVGPVAELLQESAPLVPVFSIIFVMAVPVSRSSIASAFDLALLALLAVMVAVLIGLFVVGTTLVNSAGLTLLVFFVTMLFAFSWSSATTPAVRLSLALFIVVLADTLQRLHSIYAGFTDDGSSSAFDQAKQTMRQTMLAFSIVDALYLVTTVSLFPWLASTEIALGAERTARGFAALIEAMARANSDVDVDAKEPAMLLKGARENLAVCLTGLRGQLYDTALETRWLFSGAGTRWLELFREMRAAERLLQTGARELMLRGEEGGAQQRQLRAELEVMLEGARRSFEWLAADLADLGRKHRDDDDCKTSFLDKEREEHRQKLEERAAALERSALDWVVQDVFKEGSTVDEDNDGVGRLLTLVCCSQRLVGALARCEHAVRRLDAVRGRFLLFSQSRVIGVDWEFIFDWSKLFWLARCCSRWCSPGSHAHYVRFSRSPVVLYNTRARLWYERWYEACEAMVSAPPFRNGLKLAIVATAVLSFGFVPTTQRYFTSFSSATALSTAASVLRPVILGLSLQRSGYRVVAVALGYAFASVVISLTALGHTGSVYTDGWIFWCAGVPVGLWAVWIKTRRPKYLYFARQVYKMVALLCATSFLESGGYVPPWDPPVIGVFSDVAQPWIFGGFLAAQTLAGALLACAAASCIFPVSGAQSLRRLLADVFRGFFLLHERALVAPEGERGEEAAEAPGHLERGVEHLFDATFNGAPALLKAVALEPLQLRFEVPAALYDAAVEATQDAGHSIYKLVVLNGCALSALRRGDGGAGGTGAGAAALLEYHRFLSPAFSMISSALLQGDALPALRPPSATPALARRRVRTLVRAILDDEGFRRAVRGSNDIFAAASVLCLRSTLVALSEALSQMFDFLDAANGLPSYAARLREMEEFEEGARP